MPTPITYVLWLICGCSPAVVERAGAKRAAGNSSRGPLSWPAGQSGRLRLGRTRARTGATSANQLVRSATMHPARPGTTKVREITAYFWIVKLLSTAMGEATSDFLNASIGPAIAVPLMLIGLGVALRLQFKAGRYVPWYYWLVVVMVARLRT